MDPKFFLLDNTFEHGCLASNSDIDIVTSIDPEILLTEAIAGLADKAYCVMIWNYDANCFSTFWMSKDLTKYVQIDISNDLGGESEYGIVFRLLLPRARKGKMYKIMTDEDYYMYKEIKNWKKKVTLEFSGLLAGQEWMGKFTTIRVCNEFNRAVAGKVSPVSQCIRYGRRAVRLASRIRRKPGLCLYTEIDIDLELWRNFMPRLIHIKINDVRRFFFKMYTWLPFVVVLQSASSDPIEHQLEANQAKILEKFLR